MSDNFDGIFNSTPIQTDQSIEAEPEQHADAHEVVETPEQQEPETAEVETHEVETPADVEVEDDTKAAKSVPLATFLEIRDRMKAAEKAAADHQAKLAELEKAREVSPSIPDPLADPRGYADYTQQNFKTELLNQKMQMSHAFALQRHDPADVQAAIDWAQPLSLTDPNFDNAVATNADPISWIIEQHKAVKQQQETAALLSQFNNDPVAAARKIAMEQGWIASENAPVAQAPAATQTKSVKVRPTSLTDVPAATGKATPQSKTESFDRLFNAR